MTYGGILAGAAGAEVHRRLLLEQEEEKMTQYASDDLNDDWEFKIVRSSTGAFRNPSKLAKLIEEEAHAGWVMLEKFDNYRIRFKRPRSARAKDAYLSPGVDPYRTHYGTSFGQPTAIAILTAVVAMVLLGLALVGLGLFLWR